MVLSLWQHELVRLIVKYLGNKVAKLTKRLEMHINQLKPLVDSDSLPCHKVLTVLDKQVNQEDNPFIPNQFMGPDLSDTMKSELDNVLSQFPSFFSNKPGNTKLTKHSINKTTTTPMWSPAYTIPVHIEANLKEELDNLLDNGITEESDSLWCSPPTPVKKKICQFVLSLITGN